MFLLIHPFLSSFVNWAFRITDYNVSNSIIKKKFSDCYTRSACAIDYDFTSLKILFDDFYRIEKSSQGNDSGSVLVVMKNRQFFQIVQLFLNSEAFWSFDILKVDGVEAA